MSGMVSPVHSRRLARTLRRWRERAGYSVERAADELLCGAGTVSRMETGSSAEPLRVKSALELYGAPAAVVADMVEAAKRRRRRGVVRRPYHDFVSHTFAEYLDLENEASQLRCYQSDIVHGLVQTEDYIRALLRDAGAVVDPADADKLVGLRLDRQQRLTGENPLGLRVVLGEAALYTEVGGPAVLRDQLEYLVELAESSSNIGIRILPFTAGGHPALGCNFTLLAFAGADYAAEPESIYTENVVFFSLGDDDDDVARFQRVYDEVWAMSADAEASVEMMRGAQAKLAT